MTQQQIGLSGGIHGYNVIVLGDLLTVTDGDGLISQQTVEGLGAFIATAGAIRLGWGRFEDDMEVLYLYDTRDGNFGYALNLLAAWCSEWGYAPFTSSMARRLDIVEASTRARAQLNLGWACCRVTCCARAQGLAPLCRKGPDELAPGSPLRHSPR